MQAHVVFVSEEEIHIMFGESTDRALTDSEVIVMPDGSFHDWTFDRLLENGTGPIEFVDE